MKARFGKKHFRQIQRATHGRIGRRRGTLWMSGHKKITRHQVLQALKEVLAI